MTSNYLKQSWLFFLSCLQNAPLPFLPYQGPSWDGNPEAKYLRFVIMESLKFFLSLCWICYHITSALCFWILGHESCGILAPWISEWVSESRSVLSDCLRIHGLNPWNSPGQHTGVGSLSLPQGIFPTQGLNPGLPHCRRSFYQLSLSSLTRDQTLTPCLGRQSLNHWTARDVPPCPF